MAEPTLDDLIRELDRTPVSGLPALLTKTWHTSARVHQARVAGATKQIADALRSLNVDIDEAPKEAPPAEASDASSERDYGDVIKTVGLIVDDRLDPTESFGASDIAKVLRRDFPEEAIEMAQIHNAIRGLKRQGRIRRVGRGEYIRTGHRVMDSDHPDSGAEAGPETSNQGDLPMTQDNAS